ncbi:MAG: hypothetical protein ACJA01_000118 [Saprospiraceae bacterium]|jgi:hypothetical protein
MYLQQSLVESSDYHRRLFNKLSIVSFLLVFFYGCTNEVQNAEQLRGNWLLEYAERSGRPTTTLKDAYFTFIGDSLLRTNILQEDGEFSYKFTGETILQSGDMNITYDILHFTKDTLVLNAKIRKYDFKFLLLRDTAQVNIIE